MRDPDPRNKEIVTNSDEQEVAVNHSTAEQGYDEPVNAQDSGEQRRGPEDAERDQSLPEKGRHGRPQKNDEAL